MRAELMIFAKFPEPGRVKTRLIPFCGEVRAAGFARAFLLDLLERLGRPELAEGYRRHLFFDPPGAAASFRALLAEEGLTQWTLRPQAAGDLGQRLRHALGLARRGAVTVFLGMDCPDLSEPDLARAQDIARRGAAALQPARDGGYVLLALPAGALPEVFEGIRWSTAQTAADQEDRLRSCGLEVERLREAVDVDAPEDLIGLYLRLLAGLPRKPCPRTWELLKEVPAMDDLGQRGFCRWKQAGEAQPGGGKG